MATRIVKKARVVAMLARVIIKVLAGIVLMLADFKD